MSRILIDFGHGGSDTGAVNKALNIVEKDLNLKGGLLLCDALRKWGHEVFATRESDANHSLDARGKMAKDLKVDLIWSFHFNAYNTTARGFECIYSYGNASAKWVAEKIAEQMAKSGFALRKDTVYTKQSEASPGRNWFGVLRSAEPIPGIITEGLFIDNSQDIAVLNSAGFWDRLIAAYVKGANIALGIEADDNTPPQAPPPAVSVPTPPVVSNWEKLYKDRLIYDNDIADQLSQIVNKLKG